MRAEGCGSVECRKISTPKMLHKERNSKHFVFASFSASCDEIPECLECFSALQHVAAKKSI